MATVLSLIIGAAFTLAVVAKLFDFSGFRRTLQYRFVLYVDLVVAGLLLLAFSAWIGMVMRQHLPITCPCFGQAASNVSWPQLTRNFRLWGSGWT